MLRRLEKYIKINSQDPCPSVRQECAELEDCLRKCTSDPQEFDFEPGQCIYMTGFSGEKGTDIISRFHGTLIKDLPGRTVYGSAYQWISVSFNKPYIMQAGERGVFQCLFELHQKSGLGFSVNADCIPLSSYTCAVTDLLGLDPFKLLSAGCTLYIVPENGNAEQIQKIQYAEISGMKGYPVLIGHLTKDNNMIIKEADRDSLLNRITRDELLKILDTVS